MPALNSYKIPSSVNPSLKNNGLYWLGVAVGATSTNEDQTIIRSSLGRGPLQRLHLKANRNISINVNSIVAKTVNQIEGAIIEDFNAFEYYRSLVSEHGIIRTQENKPVLTSFNIDFSPNSPITCNFLNTIINPTTEMLDLISEIEEAEGAGDGTQVEVYANEELGLVSGGIFFNGVSSVNISMNPQLIPLERPGGIYGYYYGQPFAAEMNVTMYEKEFETYSSLFMDVNNLQDITIGPFTIHKTKMTSYNPSVQAGAYKQISISLLGKNVSYNAGE